MLENIFKQYNEVLIKSLEDRKIKDLSTNHTIQAREIGFNQGLKAAIKVIEILNKKKH